jgi:hypothetical protein
MVIEVPEATGGRTPKGLDSKGGTFLPREE